MREDPQLTGSSSSRTRKEDRFGIEPEITAKIAQYGLPARLAPRGSHAPRHRHPLDD